MSITNRQNRLLVAEDWKRIYQSYRNADFKSYDFDNLRRTMINYLRQNYAEDYNDYIESSEYLALIDLIAFLGQNLAFRIDLNARENYLELAERRESILRLARLLSYNTKRNIPANGLLKITAVRTTENIADSNNINLQNQSISWNDSTNPNWYEQFIKILNRALPINNVFGKPTKSETLSGVYTEKYNFNSINADVPVYPFTRTVTGKSLAFEIVATDINSSGIYETPPFPGNTYSILYRDDGRGASSSNSGFFAHFRQGTLQTGDFTIDNPSTNQTVAIDVTNINNNDVWLYSMDSNGIENELWTKVEALEGNNIIYNSLSKKIRNIYSVLSRIEDRISLIFSDGTFGNLPRGSFRIYYRTSENSNLVITPRDFAGISIDVFYTSRSNTREQLTLTFALQSTVDNASPSETDDSIKLRAPANFYTQDRLVTAEDYQIGPLVSSQEIIKVKSVNRVSSGISRYFDLLDSTGKYSQTNLFGVDGVLYFEKFNSKNKFSFTSQTDVENIIINVIEPILESKAVRNFYYNSYPKLDTTDLNIKWNQVTSDINLSTGYFENINEIRQTLGSYTSSILSLVKTNSLIKFVPPAGSHFTPDNKIASGLANYVGATNYKWCKVISVFGDGTQLNDTNGPVLLNEIIPSDSQIVEIIPSVSAIIQNDIQQQIIDQVFAYNIFGLRYDRTKGQWLIITEENLNVTDSFSIGKTGDVSNQKLDASWILKFTTDNEFYTIESRGSRYIFESDTEIRFYFDSSDKVYNTLTGKTVKDRISILSNNNKPDSTENFTLDLDWEITEEYRDPVGYINSKKIQVTFFDNDDDGVVDNPEIFTEIVAPSTNLTTKYVFLKKYISDDGVEDYNYVNNKTEGIIVKESKSVLGPLSLYDDGQVFYFVNTNTFEKYNKIYGITESITDYKGYLGRDNLKFHYVHSADDDTRIDPSVSNIIDVYMLTKAYDISYRNWLADIITTKPLPPSSDNLYVNYGTNLNNIKSLTDEIIYHPVKYRPLFGEKADASLQCKFKIVKNIEVVTNDNDLKSRIRGLISNYFALENWDFGDTFYFSELSAYVMQEMAPDIVTFIIVSDSPDQGFGSLFEIKSEVDEIFISAATVDDIEIIDAVTAGKINSNQQIVSSVSVANTGIQSS